MNRRGWMAALALATITTVKVRSGEETKCFRSGGDKSTTRGTPHVHARMQTLWTTLHCLDERGDPAGMAFFLGASEEAVVFFAQRIESAKKPQPGEIETLIAELGSPDFARRTKASAALERWHRLARPAVQSALYKKLSLEMQRRLELLINKMDDISRCPEILRQKNVVWILYKINTPSARKLLREWSMGAPEAYLTREARDRLDSLEKPTR